MYLKYFDLYVAHGLKPIALYKNSKRPISKGWNQAWSIKKWRGYFETDKFGMGILLGDIVDVEGDTPQANELLLKLTEKTPHPAFKSSKSIHHLFLNPDKNLTRKIFDGIEFRAYNHQSVIPPSRHEDGAPYQWCKSTVFPIPEMPQTLLEFYQKKLQSEPKNKKRLARTYKNSLCHSCGKTFKCNKRRLILEVQAFRAYQQLWQCRKCRAIDIREMCRSLRKARYQSDQFS